MNISYFIGKQTFKLAFKFFFHAKTVDCHFVPDKGPVILAANHASFIDPPFVGTGVHREVSFLARESLFRFPGIRELLLSWKAVPVDRDGGGAKGLKIIIDRLKKGEVINLFPEGTRTPDGDLQPAQSGIGLVIIKSEAPVVPVRVFGTFEAYNRNHRFPRPVPIMMKCASPLLFEKQRAEAKTCSKARLKEIYQEVADILMKAISEIEPFESKRSFP